jgi:hypothetical protein
MAPPGVESCIPEQLGMRKVLTQLNDPEFAATLKRIATSD